MKAEILLFILVSMSANPFNIGVSMIHIPSDFQNNPLADKKFRELIELVNRLEGDLDYSKGLSKEDEKTVLSRYQHAMAMRGFL